MEVRSQTRLWHLTAIPCSYIQVKSENQRSRKGPKVKRGVVGSRLRANSSKGPNQKQNKRQKQCNQTRQRKTQIKNELSHAREERRPAIIQSRMYQGMESVSSKLDKLENVSLRVPVIEATYRDVVTDSYFCWFFFNI